MVSERNRAEQLFRTYYSSIFYFFLRRGLPREDSKDLAQETFSRAVSGLERFRGDASDRTWLFRIARNLWLNRVRDRSRRQRRMPEVALEEAFEQEHEAPDRNIFEDTGREPDPEERLLHDERLATLRAALTSLPPQRRRCLVLRIDGLKYREIAALLDISTQAVRSHLFLARRQLHDILGEELAADA